MGEGDSSNGPPTPGSGGAPRSPVRLLGGGGGNPEPAGRGIEPPNSASQHHSPVLKTGPGTSLGRSAAQGFTRGPPRVKRPRSDRDAATATPRLLRRLRHARRPIAGDRRGVLVAPGRDARGRGALVRHRGARRAEVLHRRVVDEVRRAARVDAGVHLDLLAEAGVLVPLLEREPPVRVEALLDGARAARERARPRPCARAGARRARPLSAAASPPALARAPGSVSRARGAGRARSAPSGGPRSRPRPARAAPRAAPARRARPGSSRSRRSRARAPRRPCRSARASSSSTAGCRRRCGRRRRGRGRRRCR